jgi:hypothetical protein
MRGCVVLLFLFRYASASMCVQCTPGKFQTGLSGGACENCGFNTHAPAAGMTACIACAANTTSVPGSWRCSCLQGYTRSNSSSDCSLACSAGFAKNSGGDCVALSNATVVLKIDMTLSLPNGSTTEDAEQAIAEAISAAYNVSSEYLQVKMTLVPPASRRRLLQTEAAQYAVEVRVSFPAGTSSAEVAATQSTLAGIDASKLNAALQSAPERTRISVLSSTVTEVSAVGAASPTPSSTAAPTTTPTSQTGSTDMLPIIAGAGGGLVAVIIVAVFCVCSRQARQTPLGKTTGSV